MKRKLLVIALLLAVVLTIGCKGETSTMDGVVAEIDFTFGRSLQEGSLARIRFEDGTRVLINVSDSSREAVDVLRLTYPGDHLWMALCDKGSGGLTVQNALVTFGD